MQLCLSALVVIFSILILTVHLIHTQYLNYKNCGVQYKSTRSRNKCYEIVMFAINM